jgi:stage II sporulation protein GA (sporulation sigma-E factor processing peptidase)
MTVVYIDSVFVLNALADYLLVYAAAQLAGTRLRRLRFLLAALLGGAYAVAVFLPGLGWLSTPPVKVAAGVLMALAAYGGEPRFLRLTLLLFLVSCGFAGCVLALGLVAGQGLPMENGVFYTNVDAKILLISAAAAYLVLTVVFRASARHGGSKGFLIPVTVAFCGCRTALTALCDTGNTLRDPATGRPVLVASAEKLRTLWPPELGSLLTPSALCAPAETLERLALSGWDAARFRLLPYSAVGVESGLLLAIRLDWASINGKKRERLLLALSPTPVGDGCDALWGELEG